jgi:ComF family protein
LAPPICERCGLPAAAIEGLCSACRQNQHAFDFARSALLFNDVFREIIHHLKYSDRLSLARPLGERLKACLEREPFQGQVILPVPLHRRRERQRGYNQAELLARCLNRRVETRLLRRRKHTPSQTGLSRPQRALNLAGAFEVRGKVPDCLIVVDDVYTTGATLNEVARTLKANGVSRVEVLTAARVPSQK